MVFSFVLGSFTCGMSLGDASRGFRVFGAQETSEGSLRSIQSLWDPYHKDPYGAVKRSECY